MEVPLEKVNVRSSSLTPTKAFSCLLSISAAIVCSGTREGENELRMILGGPTDATVIFDGNDGAERQEVGSVTKTPNIFELLGGKSRDLGEVEVG